MSCLLLGNRGSFDLPLLVFPTSRVLIGIRGYVFGGVFWVGEDGMWLDDNVGPFGNR